MVQQAPTFGTLVRRYRVARGLTQEELAVRARLSVRGLQDLERGARRRPRPETARRLSEALELSAPQTQALLSARHGARTRSEDPELTWPSPVQPLSSLVGRGAELEQLELLLQSSRLVTLTGPGGIGKTRLALALVERLHQTFADRLAFVDLTAVIDPHVLGSCLVHAFGLKEYVGPPPLDGLIAVLGDRPALLVLDNCEQIVAACAELVEVLLRACSGLRILATSRELLRVPAEVSWVVAPLELPPADASREPTPSELTGCSAVRLFLDRARVVRPGFALTPDNAPVVAEICRRLDGLPLAIELAAARLRILSPREIRRRLEDGIGILSSDLRTAPDRQRTLRAALESSYISLEPPDATLFKRLAVFPTDFDLAAADVICGDGALDGLTRLVEKSLVVVVYGGSSSRLRLLEPVRQFARALLLEHGELAPMQRRHAEYYLHLAEQAEPRLKTAEQSALMDHLEREQANFRAALEWAEGADEPDIGLRFCNALVYFWRVRGYLSEGQRCFEAALARSQDAAPALQARGLCGAGYLAYARADYERACAFELQALARCRELGDRWGIAFASLMYASARVYQGQHDDVQPYIQAALSLFEELGDTWGAALTYFMVGWASREASEASSAHWQLEKAIAGMRATGDPFWIARTQLYLAGSLDPLAEAARIVELSTEALQLLRRYGTKGEVAFALERFAWLASRRGEHRRATTLIAAAAAHRERRGVPLGPVEQAHRTADLDAARAAVGDAVYTAAWNRGRAMSVDAATAFALEPASAPPRRTGRNGHRLELTPREREIVRLVAAGSTDRDVAAALMITEGTVGSHLAHIFDKLGFHSRARLGAWAVERGLVVAKI